MDETDLELMKENDFVVIKKGEYVVLRKLKSTLSLKVFNMQVGFSNVIGQPYGRIFQIELGKEQKNPPFILLPLDMSLVEDPDSILRDINGEIDNRDILDDNDSQLLTTDEISNMRRHGISCQNVMESIISNSKTFTKKTAYSQDKYLKRKSRKYTDYIQLLKPSIRLLLEVLIFKREIRQKLYTFYFRYDMLSYLMSCVNFVPSGKYILYETDSESFIAAMCLNQISLSGKIINVVDSCNVNNDRLSVDALALTKEKLNRMIDIPVKFLFGSSIKQEEFCATEVKEELSTTKDKQEGICATKVNEEEFCSTKVNQEEFCATEVKEELSTTKDKQEGICATKVNEEEFCSTKVNQEEFYAIEGKKELSTTRVKQEEFCTTNLKIATDNLNSSDEIIVNENNKRVNANLNDEVKKKMKLNIEEEVQTLKTGKADGLIIVSRVNLNISKLLIRYLKPSRPFVIYSQYQEPLVKLYLELKENNNILNLKLVDNWLRSYQVFDQRTHPDVLMNSNAGFLLSGLMVE